MLDVQFDEGIFGYKGLHPQDNVLFEHIKFFDMEHFIHLVWLAMGSCSI
jgi:hypothetical protein